MVPTTNNGIMVIEAVKSFDPDIKVIAFTAIATTTIEKKARAAGCDAYLTKPMNISAFRNFIKQYLDDS